MERELQGSVLSVTTCSVIIISPEQRINPSARENTNTRSLDIQQSLVIHCLCIDDITGSLSEWERIKESGNIIWNVQNVFTSEYRSRIFITLHNTQG